MTLTRLLDLDSDTFSAILERAARLATGAPPQRFENRILGLVFEKPSTRTRLSFESAAFRLGAGHIFVTARDSQMQRGEPMEDMARVMGGYVDAIAMRTYSQDSIDIAAEFAGVPVINALSDLYHPCQAVADLLTVEQEFGRDRSGLRMVYLGDGNNVFASLAEACVLKPFDLVFCGPEAYDPPTDLMDEIAGAGGSVSIVRDPQEAVRGANVIYTDVWTSMGQEEEAQERRQALAPYQVNRHLVDLADNAIVLHCLPAHRDEEITADVIDGPESRIFQQAHNRMWGQMALLETFWSAT